MAPKILLNNGMITRLAAPGKITRPHHQFCYRDPSPKKTAV
jgi:hypothetical protein